MEAAADVPAVALPGERLTRQKTRPPSPWAAVQEADPEAGPAAFQAAAPAVAETVPGHFCLRKMQQRQKAEN